jgi:hypothetical protein
MATGGSGDARELSEDLHIRISTITVSPAEGDQSPTQGDLPPNTKENLNLFMEHLQAKKGLLFIFFTSDCTGSSDQIIIIVLASLMTLYLIQHEVFQTLATLAPSLP